MEDNQFPRAVSEEIVTANLLQHGADVNAVEVIRLTPLHLAAENNSKEIAADLLQRGADVNAVDEDNRTSLHLAAKYDRKDIAVDLLQREADVNAVDGFGHSPLHLALINNSKEIAADLLQRGADVNAVDGFGHSPLHLAAENNNKEIAADLLQRGADVNAVDEAGDTPLHLSALYNSKEIVADLLQREADVNALNATGNSPLDIASKSAETDVFVDLCQNSKTVFFVMNKRGETTLHLAATSCITHIIQPQIMVNKKQSSRIIFPFVSFDYSSELIVNVRDIHSNTPLHRWSMVSGQSSQRRVLEDPAQVTECGKSLIAVGALVNARNTKDQTPLHVASSWEAVDILLENGARPNVTDMYNGDTPLIARVKLLDKSSHQIYEDFGVKKRHVSIIEEWENIISKGLDPWIASSKGETILGLLIMNNNALLAKSLISTLITMNELDKTMLHLACLSVADEFQSVIDDLLKAHANINASNASNETPLHVVCRRLVTNRQEQADIRSTMHFWVANRLLAYGADPKRQGTYSDSCFDIAAAVPELLDLLNQPIDPSAIPPLTKWSDPKSENYRSKIAQVVRNQQSNQIDCYHYHDVPIGSGAFGHVFAGVDERNGREIAVKRVEMHRLHRPENRREIDTFVKLRDCEEIVKYLGHH